MAERKLPPGRAMARVGNYIAPVDTAGVDPAMKNTMNIGVKKRLKKPGLIGMLKDKMGLKY